VSHAETEVWVPCQGVLGPISLSRPVFVRLDVLHHMNTASLCVTVPLCCPFLLPPPPILGIYTPRKQQAQ
jgi:hypothetical protein